MEKSAVGEKRTHTSGSDICLGVKFVFALKKTNNKKVGK